MVIAGALAAVLAGTYQVPVQLGVEAPEARDERVQKAHRLRNARQGGERAGSAGWGRVERGCTVSANRGRGASAGGWRRVAVTRERSLRGGGAGRSIPMRHATAPLPPVPTQITKLSHCITQHRHPSRATPPPVLPLSMRAKGHITSQRSSHTSSQPPPKTQRSSHAPLPSPPKRTTPSTQRSSHAPFAATARQDAGTHLEHESSPD